MLLEIRHYTNYVSFKFYFSHRMPYYHHYLILRHGYLQLLVQILLTGFLRNDI